MYVLIPVSPGELADKLTILDIKQRHFKGDKLMNVEKERDLLREKFMPILEQSGIAKELYADLTIVNRDLFDAEDCIRMVRSSQNFYNMNLDRDEKRLQQLEDIDYWVANIHHLNKRRAEIKDQINQVMMSTLRESKDYAAAE
jgi:hypothetical protein